MYSTRLVAANMLRGVKHSVAAMVTFVACMHACSFRLRVFFESVWVYSSRVHQCLCVDLACTRIRVSRICRKLCCAFYPQIDIVLEKAGETAHGSCRTGCSQPARKVRGQEGLRAIFIHWVVLPALACRHILCPDALGTRSLHRRATRAGMTSTALQGAPAWACSSRFAQQRWSSSSIPGLNLLCVCVYVGAVCVCLCPSPGLPNP